MFKKAKHWLLILLVCVLFVGLIPGKASAAAASVEDAIQAKLPAAAPEVPELNLQVYPYVVLENTGTEYRICLWTENGYGEKMLLTIRQYCLGAGSGYYYRWSAGNAEWEEVNSRERIVLGYFDTNAGYVEHLNADILFSNFTIYHYNGTVVHFDDMAIAPDVPTFRVNLPNNYVYQYKLNDIPAQLYVDAYVSASGQTLLYTWQKEVDGEWIEVDYGELHGKYYTPPTTVEGTYRYRCKVTNTIGEYTSVAYSNSVYVLVGNSASIPEDGGEISAKDQLIIDQMGQIKDEIGNVNDNIEALPDKITDGMGEVLEQEKQEAVGEGNELIEDMTDLIEDPGEAGVSALMPLMQACSYEGRDAVLSIPALRMPAIDGLINEATLLPAQEIDLSVYFEMFPEALLTIVQVTVLLALMFFILKDMYGLIEYFATLRGDK